MSFDDGFRFGMGIIAAAALFVSAAAFLFAIVGGIFVAVRDWRLVRGKIEP